MLINTFLDTEDFVHLYYPEDEPPASAAAQGCGAGARMASKYANRPPSPAPRYDQVTSYEMCERERARAPPPPEPPPHRVRAADLYPRVRTHYDEPGVDVPFVPICGEFVQWVGRTADGGAIAASNYRVHVQGRRRGGPGVSVPLRLLDAVDVKDLLHLLVFCKDGRTLKCSFNTSERCAEWCRRLSSALAPMGSLQETFAAAYAAWAREQPPASIHRALMRASQTPQRHWFAPEMERLGFTTKGAWRVTAVNTDYRLCSSYPPLLVVPASICDEDLDSVARFRAMRRVPAVVWRHRGNGAVIARSSQPEVGWLGWRSSEDERLLAAFVSACASDRGLQLPHTAKQIKLLIVDARSYASAVTNRARGGGCECQQYYPAADIQFMCLPNIHHVRKSFQQLRQLAAEPPDQTNWHSNLERTLWLQYISGLGRAVALVARAVMAGRPVLVHCSDGWDRTPQIVAGAQLILDPYYRTCEGFRVLIEREWLDFGHKFADRCGHQFGPEDPNERSPIFLQWLDYVHQIMRQYPCSFEFSEAYLIKLVTHAHSCMFGTFLCNSPRERAEQRIPESTAQVWRLLDQPAYRNHLYTPPNGEQVLWPDYNVRALRFWSELMVGWGRTEADDDGDVDVAPEPAPPGPSHAPHHQPHAGPMTKTRSCDNLLAEGEKRTAQRRCSDPNIAPDALKLASILPAAESASSLERPDCRSAVVVGGGAGGVTDSYVDGMMARAAHPTAHDDLFETAELSAAYDERQTATDQVDGTQLNHFDNSSDVGNLTRDIASNSSSLERELAAPINTSPMTPADPLTPEEPSVFVEDTYGDVGNPSEMNRETGRTRHISITWRSVSESSHQTDSSAGFDLTDASPKLRSECNQDTNSSTSVSNGVVDNHNSTDDDLTNHNVSPPTLVTTLANRNATSEANLNVVTNGTNVNHGIDDISAQLLAAELGGPSSSSVSSESETEGSTNDGAEGVEGGRILKRGSRSTGRLRSAPRGSQQTLCPGSPSMALRPHCASCCYCCRRASGTSGVETSGESLAGSEQCCCGPGVGGSGGGGEGGRVTTCVCGGGMREPARDPLDGLPPAHSAEQIRLHQIIMHQTMLVEELRCQLRMMQARRVISPSPTIPPAARALTPTAVSPTQGRNGSNGNGSGSASASASGSGSGSEVEVGEEARGVVWLPDSAAPRCQYCRNHFWLARRRHHCRKCGGIFCGSCSEVGPPAELPSMRVCLQCRTHR